MIYKTNRIWVSALLIIILGISGCAGLFFPDEVAEPSAEDTMIAMKIKAKLIETKELNAAAINVKAFDGSVVLSGFVETESQRQLVNKITRQIPNVKQVDNKIQIK